MKLSVSPDGFAENPDVPLHLKGMMLILGRFLDFRTGYGFPSQKKLAACAGVDVKQVSVNLIELAKRGALDMEHGQGNRVTYRLKGGPLALVPRSPESRSSGNPESRSSGNPESRSSGNPESRSSGNPIQYRSVLSAAVNSGEPPDPETAELLLILEKRGVDEEQRREVVACRTAAEIRDWIAALPFHIAAKGGKLIKSEAAILFWALRRDVGAAPRPLPDAFLKRQQLALAAAAANELAERQRTAEESKPVAVVTAEERRLALPEWMQRKLAPMVAHES
jgi:hypothetical protein